MAKNHLLRVAPFLLILSLCCFRGGRSPGPARQTVVPVFSELDPLPRAVGTCRATLGPGRDIPVQFWYPLAAGAPQGNLYVSQREAIETFLAGATPARLAEMAGNLRKTGIAIQPDKDAVRTYLIRSMTTRSVEESASARPFSAAAPERRRSCRCRPWRP